jgi:TRAP-type C4-dicarboxylate transport system permease small subunit
MAGAAPSAKPAPFLKPLDLLDRGVLLAESSLSVVIVAVMIAMGVIGAAGALLSIQNDVTRAVDDVLMNGAIWAAFLGASFATRGRKHLAIDALGRLLPDRARRVMVAVASTLGAVVASALAYGVYAALIEQGHAVDEQVQGMISSGIEGARVDRGYQFQFMIAAGFGLIAVRLLLHGFHELMAAIAGNVSPAAPPPPAPASGEMKIPHEEPDGSPSSPGDESRVAPFEQAGGVEVIIASAALLVPIPLAIGTIAFIPIIVASLAAIASLLVPLYLRHKKTKSIEATSPVPHDYAVVKSPAEPIGALAGVAAVLGVAYVGVQHGAPLFTFLGGLALFLWVHGSDIVPSTPLASAVEDVLGNHFARMSVLATIPIFTLAGYLMSESQHAQAPRARGARAPRLDARRPRRRVRLRVGVLHGVLGRERHHHRRRRRPALPRAHQRQVPREASRSASSRAAARSASRSSRACRSSCTASSRACRRRRPASSTSSSRS